MRRSKDRPMDPGDPTTCQQTGCSNDRQGLPSPAPELCEGCARAQAVKAEARMNVRLGVSEAAFEIRCFDCGDIRVQTVAHGEEPNRDCEQCGTSNTLTTVIENE